MICLAFFIYGEYKRKNGMSGIFSFEIQPTAISKIDSISISKILF
jgi:hypothetical protein